MFESGTGKQDITAFKNGIGMMGYGMHFNIVKEVETPLYARAFVIKDPVSQKKVAFVNAEICFITISIKKGVMQKLGNNYPHFNYTDENVLLTGQHTHSGPGGYSHYSFYNFTIPGFVDEVYQTIVNGIVEAIVQAEKNMQAGNIYMNAGLFEPDVEVAFNRSIKAYNANPEIEKKEENNTHSALDREMILLRIEGSQGEKIGMINWFGVHTTSISNRNTKICSDNKGYASTYFEDYISGETGIKNFIAGFAQGIAGDVSPNFIWDKKNKRMRGKYQDDFESARYNGKLQFAKAKELYEAAVKNKPLEAEIDFELMYVDFSNVIPDLEFTGGKEVKTGAACHGISFIKGTPEAPGADKATILFSKFASQLVKKFELSQAIFLSGKKRKTIHDKYKVQGKKEIFIETGAQRVLGTSDIKNMIIPGALNPSIATIKKQYKNGSLSDKPWTPEILPLQLVIIGELAIACLPGEITTVAGQRLRNTIHEILKKRGVTRVILSPYANAYCGYITTYEEYQHQLYEGGHTVFGEWTLAAFQTKFKQLALQMLEKPGNRTIDKSIKPIEFTEKELKGRSFESASG